MRDDIDDLPEPPELDLGLDDMQLDTLAGDLRDAMLTRFKNSRKPWHELTEDQQNMLAEGVAYDARQLVRTAVGLLTSWEWPRVVARLGDMKIIGGEKTRIEAKLVASNIADYRDALGENVGSEVMILMVDSETFMGAKGEVKTDPDQPDLPMGATGSEEQLEGEEQPADGTLSDPLEGDGTGEALQEIADDAGDFEASEAELAQQTARSKARAAREAAQSAA